jgi:hypothetical protein
MFFLIKNILKYFFIFLISTLNQLNKYFLKQKEILKAEHTMHNVK